MANNNPLREHYYAFVSCGLIAIVALLLTILRVPIVVRLSLLVVAGIIVVTILSRASRGAKEQ